MKTLPGQEEGPKTEEQAHEKASTAAEQSQEVLALPKDKSGFPMVRADLMTLTPVQWLIKNLVPALALILIFSAPGLGKSFWALDLACCLACGRDFHGMKTKAAGPVFIIVGEGLAGIPRRVKAWEIRNQSLEGKPLYFSTLSCTLTDPLEMARVHRGFKELAQETGNPGLIVLDTLARNFGPADENSTADMNAAIVELDKLKTAFNCAVLVVHHSGHQDQKRARGSIALRGALDVEFSLEPKGDALLLTSTKSKDAAPPPPMAFRLVKVDLGFNDDDGEPVTSAALVSEVMPEENHERLTPAQKDILDSFENGETLRAAEVSKRTGSMPNTCAKSLRTLADRGYLEKSGRDYTKRDNGKITGKSSFPLGQQERDNGNRTISTVPVSLSASSLEDGLGGEENDLIL